MVPAKGKVQGNMNKSYVLILGQCGEVLKNKLQARKYWETDINNKPIVILKEIKSVTHNYQYSRYPIASIFKAIKHLVNMKQDEKESLAAFTKTFKNAKDIMETQHGKLTI